MPNGGDKNFIRLCAALDDFKQRFGEWPARVVTYPMCIEDLRDHVLEPGEFDKVIEKIEVVEGEVGFRAEDDAGNVYDYGNEGFPERRPEPNAERWLGVSVRPDLGY